MPTIQEIDEALKHATAVPPEERGELGQAFIDRLLSERTHVMAVELAKKSVETELVSQFSS